MKREYMWMVVVSKLEHRTRISKAYTISSELCLYFPFYLRFTVLMSGIKNGGLMAGAV